MKINSNKENLKSSKGKEDRVEHKFSHGKKYPEGDGYLLMFFFNKK